MDEFLETPDDATDSKHNVMIVPPRAKSSAELEQRERDMMARAETLDGKLPIPFRMQNDQGEWEIEPPGDFAVTVLAELGISEDEYLTLMTEQIP